MTWHDGLAVAYGPTSELFVSPAVQGWTFVVGLLGLPPLQGVDGSPAIAPFVARLSRELDTTVQVFFTHRVTETHAWVLANRGELVRAFAYSGEEGAALFDTGAPTEVERSLTPAERSSPDEGVVLRIAGAWGLDPQTLDQRSQEVGAGWVGRLE